MLFNSVFSFPSTSGWHTHNDTQTPTSLLMRYRGWSGCCPWGLGAASSRWSAGKLPQGRSGSYKGELQEPGLSSRTSLKDRNRSSQGLSGSYDTTRFMVGDNISTGRPCKACEGPARKSINNHNNSNIRDNSYKIQGQGSAGFKESDW